MCDFDKPDDPQQIEAHPIRIDTVITLVCDSCGYMIGMIRNPAPDFDSTAEREELIAAHRSGRAVSFRVFEH